MGRGLSAKLGFVFFLQAAIVSGATFLGVYAASAVLKSSLLQSAMLDEAQHYQRRLAQDPNAPAPNTANMVGYLRGPGRSETPPDSVAGFEPGFHELVAYGRDHLVYVSDIGPQRLYLVFESGRVDDLAIWLGVVPLAVVLLLIYLVSWLAYKLSRRAVSPVVWLARTVENLDPKAPDVDALDPARVPTDSNGEVLALTDAVRRFAERIQEFVDRERNFTRDASHELRTPLTVIKIACDLLLEDRTLRDASRDKVKRMATCARDMEALMEVLLLLARESEQSLPSELVDVNAAVSDQLDRCQILVTGKPVSLTQVDECTLTVSGSLRVVEVMLGNLIRNACLYTERGSVTVTVGEGYVEVSDTGVGMSESEIEQAFEPHFRGRRAKRGGHGVGLTIVKRLSDRFGWPVELAGTRGEGTAATIRFPHSQTTSRRVANPPEAVRVG